MHLRFFISCLMHPSFNRRRWSFSGRCFLTVEHCHRSLKLSGREFQSDWPTTEKARGPSVLFRYRRTTKKRRVADQLLLANVWRPISSIVLYPQIPCSASLDFVISDIIIVIYLPTLMFCRYMQFHYVRAGWWRVLTHHPAALWLAEAWTTSVRSTASRHAREMYAWVASCLVTTDICRAAGFSMIIRLSPALVTWLGKCYCKTFSS